MATQGSGFGDYIDTDTIHIVPLALPEDFPGDPPEFPAVVAAGLSDDQSALLYRVRAAVDRYEPIRASRSRIHISMRDGAVVLAGRARTLPMKIIAERLAASAAEGHPLISEIVADPDLLNAVGLALAADHRTNQTALRMTCMQGVVRLWGPAPDATASQAAEAIARAVPGVAFVYNDLQVEGEAQSAAGAKAAVGATSAPAPTVTPPRPDLPST